MKMRAQKSGSGHVTAYNATLGSREAREAGFLREDGTSRILKKVSDTERGTITMMVDWEAENAREDNNTNERR